LAIISYAISVGSKNDRAIRKSKYNNKLLFYILLLDERIIKLLEQTKCYFIIIIATNDEMCERAKVLMAK
jgi:hypothetical protein